MTMFRNFRNQLQCFMTIFRNFENQPAFYKHIWHHSSCQYKTVWVFSRASKAHKIKIKEHTRVVKMNKKQLKIALAVLDTGKSRFPETNDFFDSALKEECEKEKITADDIIFFCF